MKMDVSQAHLYCSDKKNRSRIGWKSGVNANEHNLQSLWEAFLTVLQSHSILYDTARDCVLIQGHQVGSIVKNLRNPRTSVISNSL